MVPPSWRVVSTPPLRCQCAESAIMILRGCSVTEISLMRLVKAFSRSIRFGVFRILRQVIHFKRILLNIKELHFLELWIGNHLPTVFHNHPLRIHVGSVNRVVRLLDKRFGVSGATQPKDRRADSNYPSKPRRGRIDGYDRAKKRLVTLTL